ncbi:amino acid adenylation domain-containing protein [Actinopolyspora mzabensis]|uniref:Amino acid adenylation domain-containing protein n=1 Tax=Actinopolyspora mzabensis TaxID=995066 RepID=A0A1G9EGI8_ACTMZ|nr:non-ribosomal peptide synthetase [Actinopolyspora mzabensis]SDK75236.1 amino acid adenylation domain-containing protein [Actinopolyspora mzabensis]
MKPGQLEDVYELAPIQEGMLFHSLLDPNSGVYVEQLYFTLRGRLDVSAFRRAWQSLVDRHPIFRTGFHWAEVGKSLQAVHPDVTLHIPERDWRDCDPRQQDERHLRLVRQQRREGFDLQSPPLMRIELVRLDEELYRFFWSFPHIVMDGWSFGLALQEFATLYAAYAQGSQITLPQARPYRDYVGWWKQQDYTPAEKYWRDALAGFEPPAALEIGPPPEPGSDDESTHGYVPDSSLGGVVRDLQSVAQQHRLTVNTIVQGAWLLLLSRYYGRDDVISGATSTHRPSDLAGAQTIVGPMLTTIPVRARVEPDEHLVTWFDKLQSAMAEAREHDGVPLHLFNQWAGVPSGTPLFETDLAFENAPAPEMALHGTEMLDFGYDGRPHYPLTMVVFPQEDLPPRLIYDRRRFDHEAAARILRHFGTLLRNIAENPDIAVRDVEMMPGDERELLLHEWNRTVTQQAEPCLHELFTARSRDAPEAVAVVDGDDTLTYGELEQRANQLARHLVDRGAAPGHRVALCVERSAHTLVGILGVLKTGACYVPLEPNQPEERMSRILRDADPTILINHRQTADRTPEFHGLVVSLDSDAGTIATQETSAPAPEITSDELAYIIYTSGSTGNPKGVSVTHANVVRLVSAAGQRFDFRDDDVWTLFHSYAFDVSVFEMWGALLNGARLVVVPRDTSRSPEALHELVRDRAVTVFSQTPSAFRSFVDIDSERDTTETSSLRYVIFAGEYLDVRSLRPWTDRHGDQRPHLINMYGITETTVHTTFHRVTAEELESTVRSNIGRPLPDLRTYLLDHHQRPVPIGVAGELHVAGPGVARGYHNLPEQTRQRFLPNPFEPGERMYRSGDMARYLDNGDMEVLGRADFQIKIRGFRVEPAEIESVLREHEHVRDAIVLDRSRTAGDARLAAYVVADPAHHEGMQRQLREYLHSRVPDYMVPPHVIPVNELPLTLNGKVDRAALPAPGTSRDALDEYVAPRDETEREIARIWSELLELQQVGAHDDFFELGGHSLLGTRVVSRLRLTFGKELTVRDLFDHRTVAELALVVNYEGSEQRSGSAPGPIAARPRVAHRTGAQEASK